MTEASPARLIATAALAAALAACAPDGNTGSLSPSGERGSQSATPPAPDPATAQPALTVEAEGLRLFDPASGSARPIPFGTAQAQAMAALSARGAAETGTNAECGAGPTG